MVAVGGAVVGVVRSPVPTIGIVTGRALLKVTVSTARRTPRADGTNSTRSSQDDPEGSEAPRQESPSTVKSARLGPVASAAWTTTGPRPVLRIVVSRTRAGPPRGVSPKSSRAGDATAVPG
ncbi:MAG: hypothetical protein M3203_14190, partial [Actinomycetota bacterium]|nr:hypothetical protein [Actinomycetota bacterium]